MMHVLVVTLLALLTSCSAPQEKAASDSAAATQPATPAESEPMVHAKTHKHGSKQHTFEDAERWSKVFDAPERDGWQKPAHVVELMEIEPGSTVADIGAGTGYFLPHLSAAVGPEGAVLALDIEQSLIDHMTERAAKAGLDNVEARVCQPDDPQLADGSVDRVVIVNTWHHISDRRAYAAKLAEGLSVGGSVFVVDFTLETERGPSADHKLAPDIVMAELSSAGLEVSMVEETLPDQYVVQATRR